MKKKVIAGMLMLSLSLAMAACGTTNVSSTADASADVSAESEAETEAAEDEEADEEVTAVSDVEEEDMEEEETGEEEISTEQIDFSQVLVDNDVYSFEVTGIEISDEYGDENYVLDVTMQNKSDQDIGIYLVYSAINGVAVDANFYSDTIMAGKTANTTISWIVSDTIEEQADLTSMGIDEVTQIAMGIVACDMETYEDITEREDVVMYPLGEENAVVTERELQDTDQVLLDNDQMTVIVTGSYIDDYDDLIVDCYVQNKTDRFVYVYSSSTAVEDIMIDSYFGADMPAGMSRYSSITLTAESLESSQLTAEDVHNVEMVLEAYDDESYDTLFTESTAFAIE